MTSDARSSSVVSIDPHGVWQSGPIFSHVATTTGPVRIVATSGQVGVDRNGVIIKDPEEQIEQAFRNLHKVLEAAGATVPDVFKLVWYMVNYDHKNRLYRKSLIKFLNGHRPATTAIGVPALAEPDFIFEIEAYAAVKQLPTRDVDVVVVGAGLSGLQAAHDVQKAGYSCLVLEARDRVGGKTWSVDPLGEDKFVDLGAAWINDTNQSYVYKLAKSLGLSMVKQNTLGDVIQEDIGGGLSRFPYGGTPKVLAEKGGVENMVEIRDLFEKACQNIDIYNPTASNEALDKCTLEDWVKQQGAGETALASVRVWTRAMLGVEPVDLSALFFLDYCKSGGGLMQMRTDKRDGGQYLRFTQGKKVSPPRPNGLFIDSLLGTQALSFGLVKRLNKESIMFDSAVRLIEQTPQGVLVSTARGDVRCKRVIVSVPTPLYKQIKFSPPLPSAKENLSQSNKLGYQVKVMVLYATPWWRPSGLCGLLQSFEGPVCVTRDSSVEEKNQYSLTCFVSGKDGLALSAGTQKERFAAVVGQINRVFKPFVADAIPEPLAIVEHEWFPDMWAQGCPCPVAPPGAMTRFGHALRSTHGKIHFVGTETSFEWKGYMDGALRSGERGAKEVIQILDKSKL
ncbi:hypothetical protein LTR84_006953 [Exophiala bonariae]|uniref:Amine oxidase n=1 Tax=Exophiala bonariae TaxID=1690606 RepID=A0AAV9MZG8_9EURO|nr:hypothetical protein LTR84_006953 [Exophiala bonariae]